MIPETFEVCGHTYLTYGERPERSSARALARSLRQQYGYLRTTIRKTTRKAAYPYLGDRARHVALYYVAFISDGCGKHRGIVREVTA